MTTDPSHLAHLAHPAHLAQLTGVTGLARPIVTIERTTVSDHDR